MALSAKQRSSIARKAALAAHRTMKSAAYVAAKKKSPTALSAFLAARRKAA